MSLKKLLEKLKMKSPIIKKRNLYRQSLLTAYAYGYEDGNSDGYSEGYENGHNDGYDDDYNDKFFDY